MRAVHIDELNPKTRARVLKQISATECGTTNLATVEESITLGEPAGVQRTRTGLTFSRTVTIDEWIDFGRKLKQVEGAIQWWIGDWLRYGEKTYGEKYAEALEATEYEEGSLRTIKWVSGAVEMSLRRDNLSWSHHKEVAALEPEEQAKLLDWTEKENVSVKDLRAEIKQKDQPAPAPNPAVQGLRDWIKKECPTLSVRIQGHVEYGVNSKNVDVEFGDFSIDEVKSLCKHACESKVAV